MAILTLMKLFASKTPWYAAGLAFECTQCGRCCGGPQEGYVWVSEQEIADMVTFLGITEQQMRSQYVRKVSRRFSLIEDPKTKDCIFLKSNDQGEGGCAIYQVRPTQCRTWPFWPSNLSSPEAWAQAQSKCQGINRGHLYTCEEIETKRNATRE